MTIQPFSLLCINFTKAKKKIIKQLLLKMSANENMGYGNMGAKIKSKHSKSFVTLDFFVFCYFIVFVFLECHNYCIYKMKKKY